MKKVLIAVTMITFLLLCSCTPAKKIVVPQDNGIISEETESKEDTRDNNKDIKNIESVGEKDKTGQSSVQEQEGEKEGDESVPQKEESDSDSQSVKPDNTTESEDKRPESSKVEKPSPKYSVKVDVSDQKVYVLKDGSEIRAMICSTGTDGNETPEGSFKIVNKDGWFFTDEFQQGAKFWVGFIGGTYGFHSVPMDRSQTIIEEEAKKLGMPASHGCVRLSMEDAEWFYNTIPHGTKVEIYK